MDNGLLPQDILDENEMEWWDDIDDIAHHCINESVTNCKPKISNVILKNTQDVLEVQTTISSHCDIEPFNIYDDHGIGYVHNEDREESPLQSKINDSHGEILFREDHENDTVSEPVIQASMPTQQLLNKTWHPNLNTIKEETVYDILIANGQRAIVMTAHVSNKRYQGRERRNEKLHEQYKDKFSKAISNNGIHISSNNSYSSK